MLNGTVVAIRGNVATEPVLRVTESGTSLCSFRVAVTARRYSPVERRSVDIDTSFYTVTCWRHLAENAGASLGKGDGVVVSGRLRVREFVHDGQSRTSADIVADAVGHDLTWGVARFERVTRAERADPDQSEAEALADAVAVAGALTPADGSDADATDLDGADVGGARPPGTTPADDDVPSLRGEVGGPAPEARSGRRDAVAV